MGVNPGEQFSKPRLSYLGARLSPSSFSAGCLTSDV